MNKILFLRSEKAYLPEIEAYINYFNKLSNYSCFDSALFKDDIKIGDFDIIWEFKGFGGVKKNTNQILVHEYASLSTGKFNKFKDFLKRNINHQPDLRIFLNSNVRSALKFKDSVPNCLRDMGVSKEFYITEPVKKEYEFVYLGDMSPERQLHKMLKAFNMHSNGRILMIGTPSDELYRKFKNHTDIVFTGRVPYVEVPSLASKAIYGVNYVPNVFPYNQQTSTKLLEYLAMGLNVVSNNYQWVQEFEYANDIKIYKIESEEDFDLNKIKNFKFFSNNISIENYFWENIIEKANIVKKLEKISE